jgi:hypothetical protein
MFPTHKPLFRKKNRTPERCSGLSPFALASQNVAEQRSAVQASGLASACFYAILTLHPAEFSFIQQHCFYKGKWPLFPIPNKSRFHRISKNIVHYPIKFIFLPDNVVVGFFLPKLTVSTKIPITLKTGIFF